MRELNGMIHSVITALVLVSNSLHSGRSLPPYIPLPEYKELQSVIRVLPHEVDDADGEAPAYASFAVREVCMHFICDDLRSIVDDVGKLVGTVDFSLGFAMDIEGGAAGLNGRKIYKPMTE